MSNLNIISQQELNQLFTKRDGETKLGENVQVVDGVDWQTSLNRSDAQFVLLGIPEDIGVRANYGVGGTHTLWEPALKAILNVQHTDLLQGEKLLILGSFDFSEMMKRSANMEVEGMRMLVNEIDDLVYPVIKAICDSGKTPIIIGGGHNNAYPILKGISKSKGTAINCINLDAHTDYRAIEGRHSGNGFRYAKMDGYLKRYAMVGLHRSYNSQNVLNDITSDPDIHFCFYEDIFLQMKSELYGAIDEAIRFTAGTVTGVELDLDCIEHTLSSAATPCGFTTLQARQFLLQTIHFANVGYLHLTEGIVSRNDGREDPMTAKLISYLVTDFIRAATNKPTVFIKETEM
ncbi:MAG TPA: formimidoylglutamase [Flavipsychrobacter sp.]|nr:formimidoylglutamase [Flavipsychrobacter sp.]